MAKVDSVAVAPVPSPTFMDATPLNPPPPLVVEELVLRRSARCLSRPTRSSYADQEPAKKPGGRGRGKRKRDEEKPELAAAQQGAKSPGRKDSKVEAGERKPMPVIAAVPVSCAGVAAEDDAAGTGKSAKLRVKETLRAFNSHYLHFVQEEQKRAQAALQEIEAKGGLKRQTKGGKKKSSKQEAEAEEKEKRPSKRPDLKAITKMQEMNAVLYPEKRIGHLPGIDVGDQFYSRAEMVVLGIHSHWLNGIDYMGMKYQGKKEYENLTFPLATCIVMSGIYEDDLDKADEIIYTGQGGNDLLGNHRQIGSQQLTRGNLALKNSRDNGNPVRVIRGHLSKNSYTGKVYTYDGLYKVVDDWVQNGVQGHVVFKFKLKRLEGQPSLTTSEVRFTRAEAPTTISELPGLVCDDISGGQENIPIPATNLVDDPPVPPSGFTYLKSLKIPKGIKIPSSIIGCDCEGDCASNKNCSCAQRNGSDLPYVSYKNIGRLVEPKAVVFECGANCSCNHDCVNRTSQQGLQYRLEVFKTASKGWGVRTWDTILPGAPICEYTGVLRRTEDLDGSQNNYCFDIDCLQTMKGLDGREKRAGSEMHLPNLHPENDSDAPPAPEYCIDASSIGNFARFINHSCQPNLFVQCVLSSHNDVRLAKVTLFAADTILPLQELSYDYGQWRTQPGIRGRAEPQPARHLATRGHRPRPPPRCRLPAFGLRSWERACAREEARWELGARCAQEGEPPRGPRRPATRAWRLGGDCGECRRRAPDPGYRRDPSEKRPSVVCLLHLCGVACPNALLDGPLGQAASRPNNACDAASVSQTRAHSSSTSGLRSVSQTRTRDSRCRCLDGRGRGRGTGTRWRRGRASALPRPIGGSAYDYGYRLDSVVGPDGKIVKLPCHCGAPDCRKRLY